MGVQASGSARVRDFDGTREGDAALNTLRSLLMGRKKVGLAEIETGLLAGLWQRGLAQQGRCPSGVRVAAPGDTSGGPLGAGPGADRLACLAAAGLHPEVP
ncbi:hypothetical protein GCM10022206_53080 [Streptomyces chiangmaiensis]